MIPKTNFYKGFATSKKEFIRKMQTEDKEYLENEYPVNVFLLKPSMIEERKAFKGYQVPGYKGLQRDLSDEEIKNLNAKPIYGDWNDYVKEFEGTTPKPGEHYYEYAFQLYKIEKK